jgi:2-haloacid dehalogenase
MKIHAIIFDLGGVLIDWNPRYMYKKMFSSEKEMEWFLENITSFEWNENQDAGYPIHKATEELVAKHPEWEPQIRAYYGRWLEMLGESIHETVEIFRELKKTGKYKLYALTNWSGELFPHAREKFEFLQWFDGIVVSGDEKMRKPSHAFYKLLLERYHLQPAETLFIDDNLRNVQAAAELGLQVIRFTSGSELESELKSTGVLDLS